MTELLAREMELLRQLLADVPWKVEVEVRLPSGEVFGASVSGRVAGLAEVVRARGPVAAGERRADPA